MVGWKTKVSHIKLCLYRFYLRSSSMTSWPLISTWKPFCHHHLNQEQLMSIFSFLSILFENVRLLMSIKFGQKFPKTSMAGPKLVHPMLQVEVVVLYWKRNELENLPSIPFKIKFSCGQHCALWKFVLLLHPFIRTLPWVKLFKSYFIVLSDKKKFIAIALAKTYRYCFFLMQSP